MTDRFRRKRKNSSGDDTEYYIGIKTLSNIWNKASKFWSGTGERVASHYIDASGYNRQTIYFMDRIEIGCQTIRRYELEQVALNRGWKFPD